TAPQLSLHMRSTDFIKKEPLDYGGFGDVYLCLHVTLGQVVMKTMYTGPLRNEDRKKLLIEEGSIMASLNHERVVKLLGVIMEDGDCSLVMELIPRGNLLVMLETVSVPLSVKGRIVLEILEAMLYFSEKDIIHKDIKPENILVDKDFHIKIADLGLAISQSWSKLTKEESRRRSHKGQSVGARGAGTLSYMAPEHLESIHAASTEKSDVYSFGIVVWVVLTGVEPYANARSEDQICQCVRNGDRPAESCIPADTPQQLVHLMRWCWHQKPQDRPTFKEGYNYFHPFYMEKLAPCVEKDLQKLRTMYEGPEDLVKKMKSLSVSQDCSLGEMNRLRSSTIPSKVAVSAGLQNEIRSEISNCPASLVSSESVSVPVEASVEDLHGIQAQPQHIQSDAAVSSPLPLEEKLNQELQYHERGNYGGGTQFDIANGNFYSTSNPFLPNLHPDPTVTHLGQDRLSSSSVHSFTRAEPVHPIGQDERWYPPSGDLSLSMQSSAPSKPHLATSVSMPFIPQPNRENHWPLIIQNANGIQIGSNNQMNFKSLSASAGDSCSFSIKQGIQKYAFVCSGGHAVTEKHLDLLRDNIGAKWKRCARRLGLTDVEIENIEYKSHRDGLSEMVHQMLDCWKMKEGSYGCTIGKLLEALEGNIKVDLIQKILDTCNS
uniref:Receptor (TNFRSF)-interacting serine-threonine kinase 1, like n=1 Tax=Tetraodon nigroviridis TaxID=99883 RepID=H3CE94_TETNG